MTRQTRLHALTPCIFGFLVAFGATSCSKWKTKKKGDATVEETDPHAEHKKNHKAHAPNAKPTLEASKTGGSSSSAETWGGRLPTEGEVILIPKGATVVVDSKLPRLGGMRVEGTLRFADLDQELRTGFLFINEGTLEAGTVTKPFTKNLTITLVGKPTTGPEASDDFGTKALIVTGGVLDLHGLPRTLSWTRLGADVAAGAKSITLAENAGWKPGDRVVIATSSKKMEEHEIVDVAAVNGKKVDLKAPLKFAHFGAIKTFQDVSIDVRAEAGVLNRNIVIRGDETSVADKFGGHVMIMGGAGVKARVSNVEITAMGQFNRAGRYPFHFHLVASRCQDCFIKDSSIHDSVQRGIVVHDTTKVLVEGNVIYNTVGHNVIVETETTAGNTFKRNLALVNKAPTPRFTDPVLKAQSDEIPGNYWVKNVANTFTDNAAAGSVGIGYFFESSKGSPMIFQRNSQHAAMAKGFERDFNIQPGLFLECASGNGQPAEAKITDVTTYHNGQSGFWPEICSGFDSDSASKMEIARIVSGENDGPALQFRGAEDGYTVKDAVMIGSFTASKPGFQPGAHLQYGTRLTLVRPTFVNFGGPVLASTDIDSPVHAGYVISDARLIETERDIANVPDDDFEHSIEALDDTFLAKGFYVNPKYRSFTAGPCVSINVGEGTGALRCDQATRGAFLVVREGDKTPSEDSQPFEGGTNLAASTNVTRSDGVVVTRVSLYVSAFNTGLVHTLAKTVTSRLSLGLVEAFGSGSGYDETANIEMAIPLAKPPTKISRTPRVGEGTNGPLPAKPGETLTAAASLAAFRASPNTTYHYDAASKVVSVSVQSHWLLLEP